MAPRKSKSTPRLDMEATKYDSDVSSATSKKRKIDWATIDRDTPFKGFKLNDVKIKTPKNAAQAQKKQKTANGDAASGKNMPLSAEINQPNPFPGSELSETHFRVEPVAEWESTQRYRKFTIGTVEFEVNQLVFVAGEEPPMIGKVLEVRAGDSQHVYLRVYWMYRPEDLPDGRQPYHGDSELIASNHMDIIEAFAVLDKAEVVHWNEDPNSNWPMKDQLFWRQTCDFLKPAGSRLSKLRAYCIDKTPCNPDEPLIECQSCSGWLHASCLEEQAVADALEQYKSPAKPGRPPKTKKKMSRKSLAEAAFAARLVVPDLNKVVLTVTDRREGQDNRRWNVDINCLLCKQLIEKAADELPPQQEDAKVVPAEKITPSTEDDDLDSVIGKHDATNLGPSPFTTVTAAPDPTGIPIPPARGRGRPRKRKRESDVADPTSTLAAGNEEAVNSAKRIATASAVATTPATSAKTGEPSESIFQSGIKSVKKLLWRTM
ncbi:hypothetical protein FB567DRAFT_540715 [Paraphoma chrysanthemicola]|uniref:BAH domain-containing protein n=1 Tax=Paraphoma chrysanthemicola TaxID=798071 RepID=A0A8K0VRY5_9PLEO|nr:hypothetical protein FB567DRAFT_540715 [Paraphoma chrysanthemicola]